MEPGLVILCWKRGRYGEMILVMVAVVVFEVYVVVGTLVSVGHDNEARRVRSKTDLVEKGRVRKTLSKSERDSYVRDLS